MRKGQLSFFAIEEQLEKIYQNNGFLAKLKSLVDWEMFRGDVNHPDDSGIVAITEPFSANTKFESCSRLAQNRSITGTAFGYFFDDEYLLAYQSGRTGQGDQLATGIATEKR